ncbi:MAG: DUF5685 family protein [Candidatus Methanomethylophilaceae archaeon]|nr:DUF5685 family protein [Candidatus Methanomethylophilaceae archaeon]
MFGYTLPVESTLSSKDAMTYRNYYCETCHQLRDGYGVLSTVAVNYEMTFANILLNSVSESGIEMKGAPNKSFCVLRHGVSGSELMSALAAYTVLVTNNSLVDDETDGPDLRSKFGLLALNKAIEKAKGDYPSFQAHIEKGYSALLDAERDRCSDALVMGRLSAASMMGVLGDILGEGFDDDLKDLFLNLGIWVYVMDAIEDLDEDFSEGNYNPFLVSAQGYTRSKTYVESNIYLFGETMGKCIGDIQSAYSRIRPRVRMNRDILDNIIYSGIPASAHRILRGDRSMSPNVMNAINGRLNRGTERYYI